MFFPTTTLLAVALMVFPSAMGAAIAVREDTNNQINYYSDPRCKKYQGSWAGADHEYTNKNVDVGDKFIGSIILLPGDGNKWDSLNADGKEIATFNGLCPFDGNAPISRDANGNECYVIGRNVKKIELYTAICNVVG